MIPAHILESIENSTDLSGLAREFGVKLTRSADGFTGLCPFHSEKSPSFRVHTKGQRAGQFKCFGCGEAGSAINFVMKFESWPFLTAVKYLAERSGITLENQKATTAVQRAAVAEDRKMAEWWWGRRISDVRWCLDRAIEEHTQPDDEFCEITGSIIRQLEQMTPEERFLTFKSQVTREDRDEWAESIESTEILVTILCGSREDALRRINEAAGQATRHEQGQLTQ